MGWFSKPEVVILKETSDAEEYLLQLENRAKEAKGETAKRIAKEITNVKAGISGEKNILFELKNSGMDMVVLHDIYLESEAGHTAQIDFLVLTPKINLVLECKNLFGNIEITRKGEFIRRVEYGGKTHREGFYSPITQNQRHLQVLKECRSEKCSKLMSFLKNRWFDDFYKGLIVLSNSKTIVDDEGAPQKIRDQVIRADQLVAKIQQMNRSSKESAVSLKELVEWGKRYLEMSKKNPTNYLEKFMAAEEEASHDDLPPEPKKEERCPRCGGLLVLRKAKQGATAGTKFWGCKNYPQCKYTKRLE